MQNGALWPILVLGMSAFLILLAVVLAANGVLLLLLSRQFGTPPRLTPGEGPNEERIENYTPMLRLLDLQELEFLRRQPGFTPATERRLRQQRAALFSFYLKSLEADFRDACAALKVVMVQSPTDRHDLASMVLRNQVKFAYRASVLRFQVVLYRYGIGKVDVSGVFQPFDALWDMLQRFGPVAAPVCR